MSRLTTGISGAIALLLISGAAQFASGRDLVTSGRDLGRDLFSATGRPAPIDQPSSLSGSLAAEASSVNRSAKTDRAAGPAGSPALTRTVSLKLNGFADTTFLLRVPVATGTPAAASSTVKPAARKLVVACEPMVSVLTDVAKQLQPGRCVT
jgi:hypothetical protein